MRREKKYPAEHLEGKKNISCPPSCQKEKKKLADQKLPTPPSRVKWPAPYSYHLSRAFLQSFIVGHRKVIFQNKGKERPLSVLILIRIT